MLLFLMLTFSQTEGFLEVLLGNHQTVFVATEQLLEFPSCWGERRDSSFA